MMDSANILIVEDDKGLRLCLEEILSRKGYRVKTAEDAREALGIRDKFDIALVDIRLPDMNGMELLRLLKQREPGMDAIIITAETSFESTGEALRGGVWDCLVKPFPIEKLEKSLENLLEIRLSQANLLKKQQELKGLYDISRHLFLPVDPDVLLKLILKKAMELVEADEGSVLLFDEQSNDLRVKCSIGIPSWVVKGIRVKIGQKIAGWVASHKEPLLIINGFSNDSRFSSLKEKSKILSSISAPLLIKDRVLGVICLNRTETNQNFNQEELDLCSMMASDAALSLDKSLFYNEMKEELAIKTRELEEKNKRLRSLQKICDAIRSTLKMKEILHLIADGISKDLGYEYVVVDFVNKEENAFCVQVISARPAIIKKVEKLLETRLQGLKTPLEKLPHLNKLQRGEIAIFHDFVEFFGDGLGKLKSRTFQKILGVKTIISIPLISRNELIGAMLVLSSKKGILEEEKEILAAFAATASVAIEQSRAFESLQKVYDETSKIDEITTNLLGNVSHEFRTPITIIEGYAEILLESVRDKEKKEFLSVIVSECNSLNSLVNRMIDLARLEEGRFKVNPVPTDIRKVLNKSISEKEEEFKNKGVCLEVNLPDSMPLVLADEPKIERAFTQLLDNGLKFTQKGGKVSLETKVHADSMDIIISDTGIGIKEEQLPKIFDRFYQVDSSQTREFQGLGVGLTIARNIVDLHKGRLWIRSQEGVGTEVIVRLLIKEVQGG